MDKALISEQERGFILRPQLTRCMNTALRNPEAPARHGATSQDLTMFISRRFIKSLAAAIQPETILSFGKTGGSGFLNPLNTLRQFSTDLFDQRPILYSNL